MSICLLSNQVSKCDSHFNWLKLANIFELLKSSTLLCKGEIITIFVIKMLVKLY